MPNGDVPARAPKLGRFRRFISAIWRFFNYLFCCRCFRALSCCKKTNAAPPKASLLSRLNCCGKCKNKCKSSCCGNPFKCLTCKCDKPKCCDGGRCCKKNSKDKPKPKPKPKPEPKGKSDRKCCAKPCCSCCTNCCDRVKARCLVFREKINKICRCLFCLNLTCCQRLLKKCKCCHNLKCCQMNGCCSCCNPFVRRDSKGLSKKGSRASNNSRVSERISAPPQPPSP